MIKPLGNRVIVKPLEAEEVTQSGIIIPDVAKERPVKGKVIAVGRGDFESGQIIPSELSVGDLVLYGKYSGNEIKVGGEDVLIMRETDVMAVLDGE